MNKDVARELKRQTQDIVDWFHRQRIFKFYAASVLFVNGSQGDQLNCKALLIDFAHVLDAEGGQDDSK